MQSIVLKKSYLFLLFCSLMSACFGFERNVTSFLNYGCNSTECNSNNVTLLYVNAVGHSDTIHQIWDFTRGKPTIVTAVTNSPVTMNVEWSDGKPFKFHTPEPLTYAFAVVFNKIWEFNDAKDGAIFDPEISTDAKVIEVSCFQWKRAEIIETQDETMVKLSGYGCKRQPGNISIKLDLLAFTDYSSDLPHLIHSSNSTQVDIILDHFATTKIFNASRFALELLFISEEKVNGSMFINIRKGLDDEHTPGVFEIVEILTPETSNNGGGFVQYRPVTYVEPERDVETSRNVSITGMLPAHIPQDSTVDMFFSTSNPHRLVDKAYITFGSKGDGFYSSKNYSLWTFTMGYGSPPAEGFSTFVIFVMSIGLGIPALLMIVSGIYYVCIKRRTSDNLERLRD